MSQAFLKAYQQIGATTALEDADPHRIIALLMQKFLDNLSKMQASITNNNTASKGEVLSNSLGIIQHLQLCLDHEQGGEVAAQLDQLYTYMQDRLSQLNLTNDLVIIDELRQLMLEIKAGWDQIPEKLAEEANESIT